MRILLEHPKTVQKSKNFEYFEFLCFCCLNFICHKINVAWYIYIYMYLYIWLLYEPNVLTMVMTWWCHIMTSLWRHECVKFRHFQNHQIFVIINAIFDSYCSFCLFGSYITHFQTEFITGQKMLTSLKFCFFGQFSDVVGPHSQVKRHVTYI